MCVMKGGGVGVERRVRCTRRKLARYDSSVGETRKSTLGKRVEEILTIQGTDPVPAVIVLEMWSALPAFPVKSEIFVPPSCVRRGDMSLPRDSASAGRGLERFDFFTWKSGGGLGLLRGEGPLLRIVLLSDCFPKILESPKSATFARRLPSFFFVSRTRRMLGDFRSR